MNDSDNFIHTPHELTAASMLTGTIEMHHHDNAVCDKEDFQEGSATISGDVGLQDAAVTVVEPDAWPGAVASNEDAHEEKPNSDGIVNPQDDSSLTEADSSPLNLVSPLASAQLATRTEEEDHEDVAAGSPPRRVSSTASANSTTSDIIKLTEDDGAVSEVAQDHRRASISSVDSSTDFHACRRDSYGTTSSYSMDKKDSIWTRLAKRGDVWEDDDDDDDERFSCKRFCKNLCVEEAVSIKAKWNLLKAHPRIGIIGVVSFMIFCAASIAVTYTFTKHYNAHLEDEALKNAEDLGLRFEDSLTGATLPLFSIAEFVKDLPYFTELPKEIGPGGENGSAPFSQYNPTYRNVSGICDDPTTIDNFNRLAKNMKQSANLSGVLLQLQLAPEGVVCLIHPKNNTDDFTPPLFLDGSYLIGQDTLADPDLRAVAEKTFSANDTINVDGPFPVQACNTSDVCPMAIQNAFIARLSINMPGYNISVNGSTYPAWGFASELINGDALVERAFQDYKLHGSQYRLIKIKNGKVHVLKASPDADKVTAFQNYTSNTLNGEWVAQVGYVGGSIPPWFGGVIAASLLISLLLSWMLMLIFFEKQAHQDLLKEMLPKKALKKIQRGETVVEKYSMVTIFFCDIVGYTSMSADMRPIQVMKLLNTYYNEVDKLASKHNVFKIETIGDSYMCVGGCPDRCLGSEAAEHVALFALELVELVKKFSTEDGMQIVIRAGINSGPVVAGVVGTNRPQYTVFGDAVNAAARMETTSEKMKIQCSEMSYRLLRDAPNYQFSLSERGGVEVKGKGRMHTWFIDGATKRVIDDSDKTVEAEASSSIGVVNSVAGDSTDLGY